MIVAYPGQNCAYGGAQFRLSLNQATATGSFAVGDEVSNGAGDLAIVQESDNTNYVLLCIARSGQIVDGDPITGPSGSGTAEIVSPYLAPRARFDPASAAADAGYFAELTQGYKLNRSARWTVNGTVDLIVDRGANWNDANRTVGDPDILQLSGFSVSDYNTLQNTTSLTSITVSYGAAAGGPYTDIATVTDGAPANGAGAFAQKQLFFIFSQPANNRYIRIRLQSSSAVVVTIGNIWIGAATNTIVAENWQFNSGFTITQIDRGLKTEEWGGGESTTPRNSIRQFTGVGTFVQAAYDKWLDLVDGQYGAFAEQGKPVAICFDPLNQMRDDVGQHMHAGLWSPNGNPTAQDVRVQKSGLWFYPNVPIRVQEYR